MAHHESLLFCFISSIVVVCFALHCGASGEEREVYIIYMGSLPTEGQYSKSSQHLNMLQQATGSSYVANSLVRSYKRSFNGFAANLTKHEKQKLANMKEVVSIFPNRILNLQTSRSWDFMGFNETISRNIGVENGITVGVIDTGIWPESDSFKDDGFGPPPKKWKGACKGGLNFTCNNKVVGARFYTTESALDTEGHGSHTASTAAGNNVVDASFDGLGKGIARGGVPSSRIAVYKVCDGDACESSAILSAFDDAIADGVDIITISIGSFLATKLEEDPVAIGAFHAMAKGILTTQSAGNTGISLSVVSSVAPWLLSVAATSTDRLFIDKVVLGNGETIVGKSVNSFTLNGTKFPMVYGSSASSTCSEDLARSCNKECLDANLVKGKIVVCDELGGVVKSQSAGASGSVAQGYPLDAPYLFPLPASVFDPHDYVSITSYVNSTIDPVAEILRTEEIIDSSAPVVALFSSRGPNSIIPDVIKPDISAPGVNILAAYPPSVSPSDSGFDKRRVKYNILSGTSMACPHVAGVATYVKSFHPDWSPSAIKSAIMTTAWPMNRTRHVNAEFDYGSGHLNPVRAANPGLVYDAGKEDYIGMLCSANYTDATVKLISGGNTSCKGRSHVEYARDLNYPSMAALVDPSKPVNIITFNRTVTNVGFANSTYKAQVSCDHGLKVKVEPDVLSFKSLNEKKTFVVSATVLGFQDTYYLSAALAWTDGTHSVRSPLIVYLHA